MNWWFPLQPDNTLSMIKRFRVLLVWVFCGLLAATGQTMATARGTSAATGQMVICTGQGPVTVYIDAEGQPTAASHLCPDCILSHMVAVLPEVPVVDRPVGTCEMPGVATICASLSQWARWHQPRAPPLFS